MKQRWKFRFILRLLFAKQLNCDLHAEITLFGGFYIFFLLVLFLQDNCNFIKLVPRRYCKTVQREN
uniref:Putative ovule protein n=1 Tax=Solanum chacoense TaxID=4108 RepID=A0A0V0HWR4_SOLCH